MKHCVLLSTFCMKGRFYIYISNCKHFFKFGGIFLSILLLSYSGEYIYIYHSMRYLFGIYKESIKCGLQRNSDIFALYRSIYGISSEMDITRIYMNTVK